MFEQNNHRKYSVDQNYENDENHTTSILFPQTDFFEPKETIDLLKLKYDPQLHLNSLINACFRSHQTKMVETYQKFNQLAHLQLEEPKISNFYMNDCFVNLYDVGKYFDGKIQKYATWIMGPIPSNFKKILDNIFIEEGCIPNFQRFLLFYPTYLQKHKVLERELFEQNRIDNKIAYFIGLLACAELGSVYGMNRMLTKFTNVGGNVEWVTKRKYPEKIRRILKLNRKLARSIWQVNSDLVEQILEANYWSKDQLALIIQILSFSYTFATIALAIGLNCQDVNNSIIDFKTLIDIKKDYDSINYESNQGQRLASVIQNLSRNSSNSEQENQKMQKMKEKLQKLKAEHSKSRKSLKKSIRRSDNEDIIQNYMRQIGNQLTKQQLYFKFQHVLKPMLPDYHVIEKRTDKEYPPVDAVDANFQHTAFPLLYSLTNKVAEMTLDIINYSELMTSNNFGKMSIQDTKKFRTAIRYYCENLCGCFHFQYNYKNIQNVVTMPLKFYARLLTLSPLHINKQVLRQIRHEEGQLNLFDLGHVAILAANCKMGLAITFAMKSFEY